MTSTRRKPITGPNVQLSPATVAKLEASAPSMPDSPQMSPWDILSLERAERAAADAAHQLRTIQLQEQLRKLALELAQQRQAAEAKAAVEAFEGASRAHRKVAADLAQRYGMSWKTHSYNSETGEILESSPE